MAEDDRPRGSHAISDGALPKVQQQLAVALNRAGERDRAEEVLRQLLKTAGPSSETYGLLGRVYKDGWDQGARPGEALKATGLLRKAIDSYLRGFEIDWRDPYCGTNAVALMEMAERPDPRREELMPVVVYAAKRRVASQPTTTGRSPRCWSCTC